MADNEQDGGRDRKWAGFSDYENVAAKLHNDINRAVDAYAHLDSLHSQGIGMTPETAVEARSALLKITKRLAPEVRRNSHTSPCDDINDRWRGENGNLSRLESANFYRDGVPRWLSGHVDDIVEAGWELGYLKAGIEKPAEPDNDDEQVKEMID